LCMNPVDCKEPPPELTGCLKDSKVEVKCNPDGTYTLTLHGTGLTGTDITLTSETPGVTVAPPQQPWSATTSWTLIGATAGQTVTLRANTTRVGGGSEPGTDLCCSGEIKIVMPHCPKPPPIDVAIKKATTTKTETGYGFTLDVTNVGAGFNGQNAITVTDVAPAGITFLSVSATLASDWNCTLTAGTVKCTYIGTGPVGPGQPLGTITITTAKPEAGTHENCATVGVTPTAGVDSNQDNNKDCVKVTLEKPIDVKIDKENTPAGGQGDGFNIWVTNVGAPITFSAGDLIVKDVIPLGINITGVTAPNWTCVIVPQAGPGTVKCTYNLAGSLGTNAQLADSIVFSAVITNHEQPLKNCAVVAIGAAVGVDTNPANDQACVTVRKPDAGVLILEKKVQNNTTGNLTGWTYPVTATCGGGPTFNLADGGQQTVNNLSFGIHCSATENTGSLPVPINACRDKGTVPVWSTIFSPASVTIGPSPVVLEAVNRLDCKPIEGKTGSFILKKKVQNNTAGNLTGWTYPVTVTCGGGPTFNLTDGGQQTVNNLQFGTICSATENTGSLPVPVNACRDKRTMPVWSTIFVPASVTIGGLPVVLTAVNRLTCVPRVTPTPAACDPTTTKAKDGTCVCLFPLMTKTSQTTCGCAVGTKLIPGKGCVREIVCTAPLVPNAAHTACVCRDPLVWNGKTCVPPPECRKPAVLSKDRTVCLCPPPTIATAKGCVMPGPVIEQPTQPDNGPGKPIECRKPLVLSKDGTGCVLPGPVIDQVPNDKPGPLPGDATGRPLPK
jgi:hypothetical protein